MPANTSPLSPRARYETDLEHPGFVDDPAQAAAVEALQDIQERLLKSPPGLLRRKWTPVRGLYLWGGVGRGKTYLMDCFHETLLFRRKRRIHFHRFMQEVHALRRRYRNRRDPLPLIAREMARDRVLCLDEFYDRRVKLILSAAAPAEALYTGRRLAFEYRRGISRLHEMASREYLALPHLP